jgi:hypothetical protein
MALESCVKVFSLETLLFPDELPTITPRHRPVPLIDLRSGHANEASSVGSDSSSIVPALSLGENISRVHFSVSKNERTLSQLQS